jgi:methionyl-tRNA formyltransferase
MDRLVLLTTEGESGAVTARYLAARFADLAVIVEQPEPRARFLRRRLKRLGAVTVAGQILFMIFQRVQQRLKRPRIAEILAGLDIAPTLPASAPVHRVSSVNAAETIELLRRLAPAVIVVMGTRIIAAPVLRSCGAPFINYHAGITPKYRGVHGGYWALAENDRGNFGATVHLVDEGIDSGGILAQARVTPTSADNFSSYPYVQLAAGLPILAQAVRDALAGNLRTTSSALPSRLWSHPTLWGYLARGLRRGVW